MSAEAKVLAWDAETQSNIDWFMSMLGKFPTENFEVCPGSTVIDTTVYFEKILMDIQHGPTGPRANTGALQADLRRLRELFSDWKPERREVRVSREVAQTARFVTLTPTEIMAASKVGRDRNEEDIRMGLAPGGAFILEGDNGNGQHVIGALGECAFAKFLGVPWSPAPMKGVDVSGYQVRTTKKPTGRLPIRARDAGDQKFALVRRHGFDKFEICGHITAKEGREVGELDNPAAGKAAGPATFVTADKLHPF